MLFQGLYGFPITPGDEDGVVDTAGLRAVVRHLLPGGLDGIGLLGSTGSAPYFSRVERRRAVECAVDEAAGRVPIMAGIGALRTSEAVRLGQDAAACGADAVLLAPISYTPLTEDEVFRHFATVAGAVTLPLCIYNNPGTTNFSFSPALIGRLSRVAPILAVKTPAPDPSAAAGELGILRAGTAPGFSVGASVDARAAEALLAGFDCWYSVLAGILPGLCVPILRAARAGDAAQATALNDALEPLWALFAAHGSVRVVYGIAALLGISRAQPPRPVLPPGPAVLGDIAAVLEVLAVLP